MSKTENMNGVLPESRTNELVIQNTGVETLVYDLKIDKAHHLNETVSIVWNHCDGKTDIQTIKEVLSAKLNTKIEYDFILLVLSELEKVNLLTNGFDMDKQKTLSRRKVLMKYALPTMVAPMIMSLVTPAVAQMAGSCLGFGAPCANPAQCCSMICESSCFSD